MNGKKTLYDIAVVAEKLSGSVSFPRGKRRVRVIQYNKDMDYSVLQLREEPYDLIPIPISINEVEADIDLKVFHFPVAGFNDTASATISPFTQWMKSSIPTNHHVSCSGPALMKGSSGAPYVNRNGFVVGIHVESRNDAEEVNADENVDFELFSNSINSIANSHGSISVALLIGKCQQLVNYLNGDNIF